MHLPVEARFRESPGMLPLKAEDSHGLLAGKAVARCCAALEVKSVAEAVFVKIQETGRDFLPRLAA